MARKRRIVVHLSDTEHAHAQSQADEIGLPLAAWIRLKISDKLATTATKLVAATDKPAKSRAIPKWQELYEKQKAESRAKHEPFSNGQTRWTNLCREDYGEVWDDPEAHRLFEIEWEQFHRTDRQMNPNGPFYLYLREAVGGRLPRDRVQEHEPEGDEEDE